MPATKGEWSWVKHSLLFCNYLRAARQQTLFLFLGSLIDSCEGGAKV